MFWKETAPTEKRTKTKQWLSDTAATAESINQASKQLLSES